MRPRATRAAAVLALVLAGCSNQVRPVDPGLVSPPPSMVEPAGTANCGVVGTEANLGAEHLEPGEPLPPDTPRPATSGPHAPVPLPADTHVYFEPVDEAAAVHNLEHGYVLIYHTALPDSAVLERLASIAETEEKVIMAPYDLGRDTALAFVAWTKIQTCGPAVTAEEAEGQAAAFIAGFRGSAGAAPEPFAV